MTWQDNVHKLPGFIQIGVLESNTENRFIGFTEAIAEICRICQFPTPFLDAMKQINLTKESGLSERMGPVWHKLLTDITNDVEKQDDMMRYHFIIPVLINKFNEEVAQFQRLRHFYLGPCQCPQCSQSH